MKRGVYRVLIAALLGGPILLGGAAAMAQPSLSYVTPGAVAPGKTTEITLHGGKLDGPLHVWTSFPAQVEVVARDEKAKDRKEAVCKLTLGSNVPLGIGGIAVATADGLSDVVYLMIDDLPSVAGGEHNHSPGTAQEISLPTAIDGQCEGTLSDYFHFNAQAGERISCEVVATRLGQDFDPLVRVLDAAGNELLIADDDAATGADTRFVFTAPASGSYLLELRDNRYKPGGRYRLRLGDFPLISTPSPLLVQRGAATEISFRGPRVENITASTLLPIGESSIHALPLTSKPASRQSSGWTSIGLSELPVCTINKAAAQVSLPCIVDGVLEKPGERDLAEFQAKKGTAVRCRAITRSLGSPAIVSLRVLDAAGKQVVESPVNDSDEPVLNFSPPADGTFKLAIEELAGRGGADFTYAVECKSGPQFGLLLKNDKNIRLKHSLASGGAFYIDVQCQRVGYDGPITLGVDSPRIGWQIANHVIAAKANETRLYVQPPVDLAAGEIAELRIVGRTGAAGREITAAMTAMIQLRAARPQTPYPPAWHDGTILVSGTGPKPAFFAVASRTNTVEFSRGTGQGQLTIDLERMDPKFKDTPLTVLPVGLPAGVTAEVKRQGTGIKETYEMILKGPKDLAEGEHVLRYFAYAEMSGQGRGVMSGDIRLKVVAGENTAASATEAKTP